MIWLNGGPGCSSEDGALMEVGPYRLKDDHTLEYNDGSWNEFANIMFVDNPAGTGFPAPLMGTLMFTSSMKWRTNSSSSSRSGLNCSRNMSTMMSPKKPSASAIHPRLLTCLFRST